MKINQFSFKSISLSTFLRTFSVTTLVYLMAACTIMPKTNVKNIAEMQSPSELSFWTSRGKMMIATGKEKVSGYFYWRQQGNNFEFSLNTLLGINMFELKVENNNARLTVQGKTYKDASAELLIKQLTGYDLPISQLRWWVLGVTKSNNQNQPNEKVSTRYNEEGTLSSMTVIYKAKSWKIDYSRWQNVMQFTLPKSIQFVAPNNKIKMSITDWTLQG